MQLPGSRAYGREVVLTLSATGVISEPMHWENASGKMINTIAFDFTGVAKTSQPNVDVVSSEFKAHFVNARQYPVDLLVKLPGKCAIGSHAVHDKHVNLLQDNVVINKATLRVLDRLQGYVLRFDAAGGYGDKAGAVSCKESGSIYLIY